MIGLLVKRGIPRRLKAPGVIDADEIEVGVDPKRRKTLNKLFYTDQAFSYGITQKDMNPCIVFKIFH